MKTFTNIILTTGMLILNACVVSEGPQGPQGPTGPQGPAGESSYIFEYQNINFTAPDYEVYLDYPTSFQGVETDVALVYLLWGVDNTNNNNLKIWRQLPQTLITDKGQLIYNYDFTKKDIRLFLAAEFSLDQLTATDTDQWEVRVVIVPGNIWASARMDKNIGYYDLIHALGLTDIPVKGIIIERR
jgi:hypothetical protein